MILTLDTDVIVAALRSPGGTSRRLIELLRSGRVRAVATVGMMIEYEAVLTRQEHLAAAGLTNVEVDRTLFGLPGADPDAAACESDAVRRRPAAHLPGGAAAPCRSRRDATPTGVAAFALPTTCRR
jgi:hypothetical protein